MYLREAEAGAQAWDEDQAAAQVKGRKRYEGFIETLGRRYASGKSLMDEIPEDIWPSNQPNSG